MKRSMIGLLAVALSFAYTEAYSQQVRPIRYNDYIEKVTTGNIEYAAEQLNVDIAGAEAIAAKVFNDPTVAVSYYNNSDWDIEMGYGSEIEVSKALTFGVRRARINLARSETDLSEAMLADYFRNLRAEATVLYLEALMQHELYKVKQESYRNMRQLAVSDSIRHAVGEIAAVNVMQSRVEADMLKNELIQSAAERNNSFAEMSLLAGSLPTDTIFTPDATLQIIPRRFVLDDLVATAVATRSTIVIARKNKEVADRSLTLARRERNPEVEIFVSANKNARVHNEEAPAPAFTGFATGIAVPLKFSGLNRGNIQAAQVRRQQADMQYRQAELQVQTEVVQALQQYLALSEQVKNFEQRLLDDARKVVEGMIYSYNRGEVSLLEALDAQRTYNDIQTMYIETLFAHAVALVELERDAGIWDIEI